jgi:hypothetical protein
VGWLKKKFRTIYEALSGLDDPRGDHMLGLETRIQHLEGEIARLEALVETLRTRG